MALTPLPIAESKKPHSNRGKWRALVLIGVHVLFVLHLVHWKATGKTLSPVEPSEAMQTLELGLVNAGFILFVLLILSTLIFGRFFCGWGCHVVALQDLCSAMLGRLGIRPKPFRSRFLVFVPVFAALYMFVWPQVLRVIDGRKFPQLQSHLMTEDFWVTFPGPGIAILTFVVCGFLAVMVLGNKGFCTYGCPYGAFFYNADRFALGKIRVTDACSGCGHCTAVCTSNVRVHEEVATHKMVVDPGCMKCMDCVDACPQNALFFGLGRPAAPSKRPKPSYDWSLAEDGLGVAFFLISLYAFRGLYDSIPFLLALGLSSLAAYFLVTASRVFTQKNLRMQRFQLKSKGRFKPSGFVFLVFAAALLVLIGHSTVWQVNVKNGIATMATITSKLDPEVAATRVKQARASFETAERIALFESAELNYRIGRASAYIGDYNSAATRFDRTLKLTGKHDGALRAKARILRAQGLWPETIAALAGFSNVEKDAELLRMKADSLVGLSDFARAAGSYEALLALLPQSDPSRPSVQLALFQARFMAARQAGDLDEAVSLAEKQRQSTPRDPAVLAMWARALVASKQAESKTRELIRSSPGDFDSWYAAAVLYDARGDEAACESIARRISPEQFGLPHPSTILDNFAQ